MARFFIDRPIFAWVIAIIIMLAGTLSIINLPVAQYPPIASPQIRISASYPGASAQAVQDTVTQVIEQQMTGLDGLRYMASTSEATGSSNVTLTFENGTDPDVAQVQVQNKLQLATPQLPSEVQQQGMRVAKSGRCVTSSWWGRWYRAMENWMAVRSAITCRAVFRTPSAVSAVLVR